MTTTASTKVKRVTLPRYEVTYLKAAEALAQARRILDRELLRLEEPFPEQKGQEVVLDLRVEDMAAAVTLLFRLVQKVGDETYLEWWPRRKTDPDLLEIWIGWLEDSLKQAPGLSHCSLPPPQILGMFDRCRRALAANPFVSLDVHWTATGMEIERAYNAAMAGLCDYKNAPGSGNRARELLEKAKTGLREAREKLSTLEGRRREREKYVPAAQIDQARELARTKAGVAGMRGAQKESLHAKLELYELEA